MPTMSAVIVYDDITPEGLSDSDRAHLKAAMDAGSAARKLAGDGFLSTAIAEVGRAWIALGRCDELGPAWQVVAHAVTVSQGEVLARIAR